MTARQLSFWQADEERLRELEPAQAALLIRIDAALDRMKDRGDHLRPPVVLPNGDALGYLPLCLKRERLLNGETFVVTRWEPAEQMELIVSVARRIPESVSHSSGTAAARASKKTNAALVEAWRTP